MLPENLDMDLEEKDKAGKNLKEFLKMNKVNEQIENTKELA